MIDLVKIKETDRYKKYRWKNEQHCRTENSLTNFLQLPMKGSLVALKGNWLPVCANGNFPGVLKWPWERRSRPGMSNFGKL